MNASSFPSIAPARQPELVFSRYPFVAKGATCGSPVRIRITNTSAGARLPLEFKALQTWQMLQLLAHWNECLGVARSFFLPSQALGGMPAQAKAPLLATEWKYAKPPTCLDTCGGMDLIGRPFLLHSVEIELVAQPRRVAQYVNIYNPSMSPPVAPLVLSGPRASASVSLLGSALSTSGGWDMPVGVFPAGAALFAGAQFSTGFDLLQGGAIEADVSFSGSLLMSGSPEASPFASTAAFSGADLSLHGSMSGGSAIAAATFSGGQLTILAPVGSGEGFGVTTASFSGAAIDITETDPLWNSVRLLLKFDGTFNDSSNSALSALVTGAPQLLASGGPFGGPCALFDTGGQFLAFNDLQALSGDFTIEAWRSGPASNDSVIFSSSTGMIQGLRAASNPSASLYFFSLAGFVQIQSAGSVVLSNTWQHEALCRSQGSTRMFADGVQVGDTLTNWTDSITPNRIAAYFINGSLQGGAAPGRLAEVRITAAARYTTAFTPPGPFPTR